MASAKFLDLRSQLTEGRLLLPGDEGFEASLQRWSLACVKPAAAVAQPKTAEEVSAVVKFATTHGIRFNVKGGGHSTSQSSSSPSPDGMVLDLSLMRSVSVSPSAKTVTFQGGCLWRDVDDALWEHKLATPGGTVSHTGVGGLILHGGFGMLSGLHGLTIDNLLACEVVLADGSIVKASKTENEDLFWALRGAGSSFGVVTKFTSQAYPWHDVWGGFVVFSSDKLPQLVDFFNHWDATNDGNQILNFAFGFQPLPPDADPTLPRPPIVLMQMAYVGEDSDTKGPEFFAPVLDLSPLMKQVGVIPYPAINKGGDEIMAAGKRYLFGGANFTTPLKLETAKFIGERFWSTAKERPEQGLESSMMVFEGIPGHKIRSVPTDSMAFNNRGSYYNVGLAWSWKNEDFDSEIRLINRGFQQEIRDLGYNDENLGDGVGRYLNYVSTETINAESAFGSNAARLRELKQKYDAGNVFDKLWKLLGRIEEN